MLRYTLYVIDDEEVIRKGIKTALGGNYRVNTFSTAEAAIAGMKNNPPDLVLLDIGLPGMSGIDALHTLKDHYPDLLVIMITAYEDVDTVIAAMKLGAYDYVIKPIHMNDLENTIGNALETIRLRKEVHHLQEKYLKDNLPCFIGESNVIQDILDFMKMVAKSADTPILILGETGTGKELIASSIHYRSPNFTGPFIAVNCAAIPRDLLESELFGYEKGAFSGASAAGKKGLIEESENGTLFLDEIGDLSPEAQAKLLRFLESGEFYKVGGTKKIRIKTRVVSATNQHIERLIEKGLFRKDLYFRLGVIKIRIPTLNERRDDITPIAQYFLYAFSKKFGKKFTGISPLAETALLEHNWTGNVRELKNMIERGVLIGKGPQLTLQDLGIEPAAKYERGDSPANQIRFPPIPAEGLDLQSMENALEKFYIEEAFKLSKGNESKAAKLLNINHHTFRYRRKKCLQKNKSCQQ